MDSMVLFWHMPSICCQWKGEGDGTTKGGRGRERERERERETHIFYPISGAYLSCFLVARKPPQHKKEGGAH